MSEDTGKTQDKAQAQDATVEDEEMYKAIVAGGTGATGRHLVRELAESKRCEKVTVLVRKAKEDVGGFFKVADEMEQKKIQQVPVDWEKDLEEKVFAGHHKAYWLLGSTRKKAGSAEAFRHIDLDYGLAFARACHAAGVQSFCLMSSEGANANSWFLYPSVKGQLEEEVKKVQFPHYAIFRPSLLLTPRDEVRTLESVFQKILPSMFCIKVEDCARAMVYNSETNNLDGNDDQDKLVQVFQNADIKDVCASSKL